jgi:Domain of unknown function (DUF3291)
MVFLVTTFNTYFPTMCGWSTKLHCSTTTSKYMMDIYIFTLMLLGGGAVFLRTNRNCIFPKNHQKFITTLLYIQLQNEVRVANGRVKQNNIRQRHQRLWFSSPSKGLQNDKNDESSDVNDYNLAHMNYGRLRYPIDHPDMSEFRLAMEPINALAKSTPGFIWSLDTTNNNSPNDESHLRKSVPLLHEDPLLMPQLSLWEDIESIRHFAFKSGHAMYYKRRREWFTTETIVPPYAVCWWRPSSYDPPTLEEAFAKCHLLKIMGPSKDAFDFSTAKEYPKPSSRIGM